MRRILAVLICMCMIAVPVKASAQEKLIALTFDDGPSGRFTRRLLDGLEARNAKATFFLCGYRIELYPELTERIIENGHEIGLHGYSHKPMQNMSKTDVTREIIKSAELLPEDYEISFLRPPGGIYGPNVQAAAREQDLALLHWSIDPRDWATSNTAAIKNSVINRVRDGDVILLHDMSDSSVNAALEIVDTLQAQGYRFVTASELARLKNITLDPGQKYERFEKNTVKNVK